MIRRTLLLGAGRGTGPSLDLNFASGNTTLDSRITVTRSAATATYFDATGTLQTASANTARFDYGPNPGGVTNWIRNSTAAGGSVGTPGILPSHWNAQASTGLAFSVISVGTESGLPYIDLRLNGTAGSTSISYIGFDDNFAAAALGQTWTTSAYIKLAGGSFANFTSVNLQTEEHNVASGNIGQSTTSITGATGAGLATQRFSSTRVNASVADNFENPTIVFSYNNGAVIDVTLRIGAPQIEIASTASTWVSTAGQAAVNVGAVPKGLLVEESRVNTIRNNSGTGGVAGTPGTLPNNWSVTNAAGVTINMIGTGTENGIAYTDLQWTGTTTGAQSTMILDTFATAAAQNSIWTTSYYCRLVGGTNTGLTSAELDVQSSADGSTVLSTYTGAVALPTSAALATQRVSSGPLTVTDATVAWIRPRFNIVVANTTAVNFTLRIGLPQMEAGSFTTSPIQTTAATVTRNNDALSMSTSGWFKGQTVPGTIEGEYIPEYAGTAASANYLLGLDDGTNNNRLLLRAKVSAGSVAQALVITNNVLTSSGTLLTDVAGVTSKLALAWSGGTSETAIGNAGTVQALSSAPPLGSLTTLRIGQSNGGGQVNGWVSRIRYWSRMLSNADLATYTSGDSPTLDLNFVSNTTLDSRITFSRTSAATYFDATGTLQSASSNVARYDYGPTPSGTVNWIRNSTMLGAVAGTPGTVPTNWFVTTTANGLTRQIVGTGTTSDGFPYVDIRYSGTTTSAVNIDIGPESTSGAYATQNETWTFSAYVAVVGGSATGINTTKHVLIEYDNLAAAQNTFNGSTFTITSTLTRTSITATLTQINTSFVQPRFRINVPISTALDVTLRVAAPQLEINPAASTWISTAGSAANFGGVPLGLLIEESRTNSIRNNTNVGAVVGTPGTYPTNWSNVQNTGLIPNVIAVGTENGINYIDLQYSGTTATGTQNQLVFETGTISASPSQAWTFGCYFRLIAGSLTGAQVNLLGGDNIASQQSPNLAFTSAPLATQRMIFSFTTNAGAVTSFRDKALIFTFGTAPVAVNFTLRVGMPQIEAGAFATSPIQTSAAAATRATEVVTLPASNSFYVQSGGGTIGAQYLTEYAGSPPNSQYAISLDNGTTTDRYTLRSRGGTTAVGNALIAAANSPTTSGTIVTDALGTIEKLALAWSGGAVQNAIGNAGTVQAMTSPVPTTSLTTFSLGSTAGGSQLNGWLRRSRYWPRMMGNAELATVTTGDSPTLDLNFTSPTTLDPRITFSRASTATYFDVTGTMQTAAVDTPRYDYNPSTLVLAGLLIEEFRTNLITSSNDMSGWLQQSAAPAVFNAIGLDGRISASTCTISAGSNALAQTALAVSASTAYVFSFYAKRGTATDARYSVFDGTHSADIIAATSYYSQINSSTFTRVVVTFTTPAGCLLVNVYPERDNGQTGTIIFTGAQLEQGVNATSLIITSGIAATRARDNCTMPVSSSWYTQNGPGTLGAEYLPEYAGAGATSQIALTLDDGTTNNRYTLRSRAAAGSVAAFNVVSGAVNQTSGTLLTDVVGTTSKLALAWSGGAVQNGAGNGGTVQATTSPQPVASMTLLELGSLGSSNHLDGWLRRVRYWPRMLGNPELQTVTT